MSVLTGAGTGAAGAGTAGVGVDGGTGAEPVGEGTFVGVPVGGVVGFEPRPDGGFVPDVPVAFGDLPDAFAFANSAFN